MRVIYAHRASAHVLCSYMALFQYRRSFPDVLQVFRNNLTHVLKDSLANRTYTCLFVCLPASLNICYYLDGSWTFELDKPQDFLLHFIRWKLFFHVGKRGVKTSKYKRNNVRNHRKLLSICVESHSDWIHLRYSTTFHSQLVQPSEVYKT